MGSDPANERRRSAGEQHLVQLFQSDAFLCEVVADFLAAGLRAREPLVLIAVAEHRRSVVRLLSRQRWDVDAILRSGQLALLDAHEMLTGLTANGSCDASALRTLLCELVERTRVHAPESRVRVYSELAGLLWEQRRTEDCQALEREIVDVMDTGLTLLCSFRISGEESADERALLQRFCAVHTHTLPSEQCASTASLEHRLRHLFMLEQRVRNQEHELARARDVERKLRGTLQELHGVPAEAGSTLSPSIAPYSAPSTAPPTSSSASSSSTPPRAATRRSLMDRTLATRAEATLRVFTSELTPAEVSLRLGLPASWTNEQYTGVDETGPRRPHGWFLSSKHSVTDGALDGHLDWLIGTLEPARAPLRTLCERRDVRAEIACLWVSALGHGGPALSPTQLAQLAQLGLPCTFDVYFESDV